ncbi:N/A [soil metagenome]
MRKLVTIIIYTLVLLIVGRNLSFLPNFSHYHIPDATDLKNKIQKIITGKKGNYAITYLDLTSGKTFGINDTMMMTAASVNKVPIIAVLYYLENRGKIGFSEQITLQENDIQDYGSGSLRYGGAGQTYSVKSLAKLTLQESDNTAAHILANKIGMDVIQHTITSWGLTQTSMNDNQTTTSDMAILFKLIYEDKVTTPAKTKELLSFMTHTDIEDRLPSQLPTSTHVSHKTGDGVGFLHDVGIITKDDKKFFLGVLTSDIGPDEAGSKQTIGSIAKTIFDSY